MATIGSSCDNKCCSYIVETSSGLSMEPRRRRKGEFPCLKTKPLPITTFNIKCKNGCCDATINTTTFEPQIVPFPCCKDM